MKRIFVMVLGMGLLAATVLTGCAKKDELALTVHDEVLNYPIAFDIAYLRVMEALEDVPDWELEETEKEKGMIRVRNIAYSRFDDADKRAATIYINRISRNQTAIQLAPESQRVIGGDKLLEKIRVNLNREIA